MKARNFLALVCLISVIAGVICVSPSRGTREEGQTFFSKVRAEFAGNEMALALLCAGSVGFVLALRPRA